MPGHKQLPVFSEVTDDEIVSGEKSPLKVGNCLPLKNIPAGLAVHNIEILPRKGGQMVRSAGSSAQVMAHSAGKCTLKLPSGEILSLIHI